MALDSAVFFGGGKAAMMAVTQDMISRSGALEDDLDGIPRSARRVEGVLVGVTLRKSRMDATKSLSAPTAGARLRYLRGAGWRRAPRRGRLYSGRPIEAGLREAGKNG